MKSRFTIVGAATLAVLLSATAVSSAFADIPGTDEGRDAAIAAVENAAAAKRAREMQQQHAQQPAPASTTSGTSH